MIFGVDRFDLRVRPAHHFNWLDIFTDKTSCNFNAMATQVKDTTPASLLDVPEPFAMWSRVCFPRFCPKDSSQSAILHTFLCFYEFWGVDEIFEIAVKNSCCFYSFQHSLSLIRISSQRFGGNHSFFMFATKHHRGFM